MALFGSTAATSTTTSHNTAKISYAAFTAGSSDPGADPPPPHPTYNTAGTLYSPKSNPEPPARRVRFIKWDCLTEPATGPLEIFPKASLDKLSPRLSGIFNNQGGNNQASSNQAGNNQHGRSRHGHNHHGHSHPAHYSSGDKSQPDTNWPANPGPSGNMTSTANLPYEPLQQNTDRALSPITDAERVINIKLGLMAPHHGRVQRGGPLSKVDRFGPAILSDSDEVSDPVDDLDAASGGGGAAAATEQELVDESAKNSLDQLPVKALFNLMSYPNPNQGHARKRWEEAKEGSSSATPAIQALNISAVSAAPAAPASSASSFGPATSATPSMAVPFVGPRDGQPVVTMDSAETRARGYPTSRAPKPPSGVTSGSAYIHQPTPVSVASNHKVAALFSGSLVAGQGALPPLTAGPPGQRRFDRPVGDMVAAGKHSHRLAFETRPQTNGLDFISPSYVAPNSATPIYIDPQSPGRLSDNSEPDTTPVSRRNIYGPIAPPKKSKAVDRDEVLAALEVATKDGKEKARAWVYNSQFGDESGSIGMHDGAKSESESASAPAAMSSRYQNIDRIWYSGVARVQDSISSPGSSRYFSTGSRLTMEQANRIPTAEHTRPLLTLTMDNLIKYVQSGTYERLQRADQHIVESLYGKHSDAKFGKSDK